LAKAFWNGLFLEKPRRDLKAVWACYNERSLSYCSEKRSLTSCRTYQSFPEIALFLINISMELIRTLANQLR
jgi:hypothetical protein